MQKKSQVKQITEYIKYWQKFLNLPNWTFRFKIVDWADNKNCFARNVIDPNYEHCILLISSEDTIPEETAGVSDLEVTIVHEMLHTRLVYVQSHSKNKKKKWPIEVAIEVIAKALVAAKRGITPEDLS